MCSWPGVWQQQTWVAVRSTTQQPLMSPTWSRCWVERAKSAGAVSSTGRKSTASLPKMTSSVREITRSVATISTVKDCQPLLPCFLSPLPYLTWTWHTTAYQNYSFSDLQWDDPVGNPIWQQISESVCVCKELLHCHVMSDDDCILSKFSACVSRHIFFQLIPPPPTFVL